MRRYGKVSSAFWVDERVRIFSDDGRLAFLYLLTHPAMTSVGAMRATIAGLAAELGWSTRRLARALAPAIEAKMVEINPGAAYLALPNFLKHNQPESPNVCKAWIAALSTIPECPEREALIARCRTFLASVPSEAFPQAFEEAFDKLSGKPSPSLSSALPESVAVAVTEAVTENREPEGSSPYPPLQTRASRNGRTTTRTTRRGQDAAWGRPTANPVLGIARAREGNSDA